MAFHVGYSPAANTADFFRLAEMKEVKYQGKSGQGEAIIKAFDDKGAHS